MATSFWLTLNCLGLPSFSGRLKVTMPCTKSTSVHFKRRFIFFLLDIMDKTKATFLCFMILLHRCFSLVLSSFKLSDSATPLIYHFFEYFQPISKVSIRHLTHLLYSIDETSNILSPNHTMLKTISEKTIEPVFASVPLKST